jgi:CelD/BcsL family acetyltransferase involved in cellulose biosynthesis
MDCSIVEDPAAFRALAEPWRDLAARARARPFQEFGWHAAWFSTLGVATGRRLNLAVLREGKRLSGVLPLTRRRHRGVRLLEWSGARVTDYCDALLDPALEPRSALAALWQAVRARGGFDVARLGQVRADAALGGLLADLPHWIETREDSYGLPLVHRSGREWLASRPAKERENVRRRTRRLAEAGVGFWVRSPGEPWRPAVDALVAQKRAWAAARGERGLLDEPGGEAFFHALAAAMADLDVLHLSGLRAGDRFVACELALVRDGVLYGYMTSYDLGWAGKGPGQVLLANLAMWCCERGIGRLDLMLGPEEYKKRLGCGTEPVRTWMLPRTVLGQAVTAAYRAAKGVRRPGPNSRPRGASVACGVPTT